jgi:hypothetical protein
MAIRDEAFDGDDHGEGLDLGGHAVAGPFGFHVGDFPEAGQDLVAAYTEPAEFPGILLDELLLNGGTVLEHVGADTGFGFGVGGGIWVETGGLGGTTIVHGSSEDQAGKGYFLVGDGFGDVVFRHRWVLLVGWLETRVIRPRHSGTQ